MKSSFIDIIYKHIFISLSIMLLFAACGNLNVTFGNKPDPFASEASSSGSNADKDADKNTDSQPDSAASPHSAQKKKEIEEVIVQSTYAKEENGAPARPDFVDAFRYYPEGNFFKKGRYLLVWKKEPGDIGGSLATRAVIYRITFFKPREIEVTATFSSNDVKNTEIIYDTDNGGAWQSFTSNETYKILGNQLTPNDAADGDSGDFPVVVNNRAQLGWHPITEDKGGRIYTVGYKIRLYAKIQDYDDDGNPVEKEVYNESQVLIVKYREAKFGRANTASGTNGAGAGGTAAIGTKATPDVLTSVDNVRRELSLPNTAYFSSAWENRKLTGTTPLEQILTEADFNALFPPTIRNQGHDKNLTYYTYDNFVTAASYFPKFLGEGTDQDKYRELAAFLGNKSHETGDGWPALGAERWKYGLFWIVELAGLSASGININPADQEDLYKAYSSNYTQAENTTYPPVAGKSYHGRGPVQLSWNYNYGAMSQKMFGNKDILLANPNLIARNGVYGWASAIWFWMQPQGSKPSAHDVMVGNVDLSEPYTAPTSRNNRSSRTHTSSSQGHDAAGTAVNYSTYSVPAGAEVGFGMTINIINGGLESNTGRIDNRQARRIGYFARYLDYFGKTKLSLANPLSPQVSHGGDPVPPAAITAMQGWRNWHWLPSDGTDPNGKNFPKDDIPSILSSVWMSSF